LVKLQMRSVPLKDNLMSQDKDKEALSCPHSLEDCQLLEV